MVVICSVGLTTPEQNQNLREHLKTPNTALLPHRHGSNQLISKTGSPREPQHGPGMGVILDGMATPAHGAGSPLPTYRRAHECGHGS